jgi:hypothetical protein
LKTPAILAGVFIFMTEKKIAYALNRIKACKENGFALEALLKSYHLNLDVIKYILSNSVADYSAKDKKIKTIVHEFMKEISLNTKLKAILNKKNLRSVKPWLHKMEEVFKALKVGQPSNIKALQAETEKIFGILNISVNKLFVKNKA